MRLRFLNADDAAQAAALAEAALGPDSHIVEGSEDGAFAGLAGEDALASDYGTVSANGNDPTGQYADASAVSVVARALIRHGASPALRHDILNLPRIRRAKDPLALLTRGLRMTIGFGRLPRAGTTRLLLLGPAAAGKTTLIGKLAARGPQSIGRQPAILTTDTARPGGFEPLEMIAGVLGMRVWPIDPTDIASAGFIALVSKSVLIDTAPVTADDTAGLAVCARLALRAAAEPVLVLPADMDGTDAAAFAHAAAGIGVRRFMVTRLELARRLAPVIAASEAGLTLIGGAVTPHFAYGLRPFTPALLARRLLTTAAEDASWHA